MVKAVFDKIVVEFMKREVTKGGIHIPEGAKLDPQGYGKVLSVGEALKEMPIKEGDVVCFHPMAGMDMAFDLKIYKVLKYEELYGIIEDDNVIAELEPLELGKGQEEASKIIQPASNIIHNA